MLIFGRIVPPDQRAGESWSAEKLTVLDAALLTDSTAGLVDHDVFVLALEGGRHHTNAYAVEGVILGRVAKGGLLVCFCGLPSVGWLNGARARVQAGRVIRSNRSDQTRAYDSLLDLLEEDSAFEIQVTIPQGVPLATSGDGASVAVVAPFGTGRLLLLPPMVRSRPKVVRTIIERVLPQVLPGLASAPQEEESDEPEPEWLDSYELPGMSTQRETLERLHFERTKIDGEMEAASAQLRKLSARRGLLTLTGLPLESVVREVLTEMGLPCVKEEQVDAVYRCSNGRALFIEIEGSSGSIGVKKGRQLMHYVSQAEQDAPLPYGAIIGNPSRRDDPLLRFSKGQGQPFSSQLEELAASFNPPWKLLTTEDLFQLYRRHLEGDSSAALDLRASLLPPGVD